MGYEKPPPTLTFYKAFFSAQCKFLIHNLVQCVSAKRTAWNEFSCSMASAVICLATEVTMTMAQTLIKMKVEKARILDEQMAKRLLDEEVKQAVAREKQEKDDLEKAKVLQQQYDDKQEDID
nr:hypothetical protein [Tanacetum cinerariifolium]